MFPHTHAPLASLVRALIAVSLLLWVLAAEGAPAPITLLTVDGAIGPGSADYVVRGINRAARDGSQLVVIQMDTPGGLDLSMRALIKAILSSPVPVASFVAPSGARAASAGTYILYASHIAAMAPGTNLGAATPVEVGAPGTSPAPERPRPAPRKDSNDGASPVTPATPASPAAMERKQINDAAAYIRGLAQMRGRNAEWAELAVRESVSLSAEEALKQRVIDYVAADLAALTRQLDGKTLTVLGRPLQLHTAAAPILNAGPDWHARLLNVITNPSIALILMTIGLYGLLFEFMSPGAVAPGVIGAICLLLALYGLQLLPVNYAGLALIILGISFMIAEAFLPSFGVVGLGGVAAFVAGALILIDTELPDYGIPVGLIAAVAVLSAVLMAATVGVALRTRRRGLARGANSLVGTIAEVIDEAPHGGWANAGGETWRVISQLPLERGQKVRVVARKGATLEVTPIATYSKGELP